MFLDFYDFFIKLAVCVHLIRADHLLNRCCIRAYLGACLNFIVYIFI